MKKNLTLIQEKRMMFECCSLKKKKSTTNKKIQSKTFVRHNPQSSDQEHANHEGIWMIFLVL